MAIQDNPTVEAEGSLFDELVSFEIGLPVQEDHENDAAGTEVAPKEEEPQVEEKVKEGNETSEEEPEVSATEDTPEESVTEGDERVRALFGILETEDILPKDHGLSPTIESIPQLAETIGGKLFREYLDTLPASARDLIDIAATNPALGVDDLRKFFTAHIDHQVKVPQDDEEAAVYMRSYLKKQGIFTDPDDIEANVERLLEKGKLLETAKVKAEAELADIEQSRKAQIEQAKQVEQQRIVAQKQFYESVFSSIEEESWNKDRKTKVRQAVDPRRVQQLNERIRQSPKAVAQLALLYSFYDEKNDSFDLSAFQQAAAGKKVAADKDDLKRKAYEASLSSIGKRQATKQTNDDTGFWQTLAPAN